MKSFVPAITFAVGAGLSAATFWIGHELAAAGPAIPMVGEDMQELRSIVARIEDMEMRLDSMARASMSAVVRNDDPMTARLAPTGDPRGASPNDAAARDPAQGGGSPGGFDDLRKLREAPDDATKLALARELMKDDSNPMALMSALRVLADLQPKEAVAEVDEWVAASLRGDLPSWQAERGIAALLESKGAEKLGTDLDAKLRDWYARGDDDLKRSTARSLEGRGDAGPMQQLVASYRGDLGNGDVGTRTRSVEKLGRTRSKEAVPALVPMLSDSSDEVRLGALDAIRRTGNESAIDQVRPLLDDPVAAVRDRATRTIESLRRGEREQDWRGDRGDFRGGDFRGGFSDGGRRGSN